MRISAVIPTRNRASVLRRTLMSVMSQKRLPDEVYIVDSSDDKSSLVDLKSEFGDDRFHWLETTPSACLQRNTGIQKAAGDWIFLCDDDVELPVDYLEKLEAYANLYNAGAISGRWLQQVGGKWVDQFPVKNLWELLWRFIFQLSVWGTVDRVKMPRVLRFLFSPIIRFYRRRGNGLSNAGWPLITQWDSDSFQTIVYSLGASLVRRSWLLQSKFDEVLDSSGIGDHYGVALGFPVEYPIHVIASTFVYHHRAAENRVHAALAYYRRILALHYFMRKYNRAGTSQAMLIWSLTGNALAFLFRGQGAMFKATCRAALEIMRGRNPYLQVGTASKLERDDYDLSVEN